jgi:hypothetical protein
MNFRLAPPFLELIYRGVVGGKTYKNTEES